MTFGEQVEQRFILDAMINGYHPASPLSNNLPYDFILEGPNGQLIKIQVKGVSDSFQFKSIKKQNDTPYEESDYDFTALWLADRESWVFLPPTTRNIRPKQFFNPKSKYHHCIDNWSILFNTES